MLLVMDQDVEGARSRLGWRRPACCVNFRSGLAGRLLRYLRLRRLPAMVILLRRVGGGPLSSKCAEIQPTMIGANDSVKQLPTTPIIAPVTVRGTGGDAFGEPADWWGLEPAKAEVPARRSPGSQRDRAPIGFAVP